MSDPAPTTLPDRRLTLLLAVACGLIVANLYFAQALIGEIAPALHLRPAHAGLVVTAVQLGYGAGLFLIVPLADRVENRRLVLLLTLGTALGALGTGLAGSAAVFLVAAFATGLCAVGAQVLVPLAAHLAPDAARGRVVGNVMGGLIGGIMLARPLASGLAALGGWRLVFLLFAGVMAVLALVLARVLPVRRPPAAPAYPALLRSGVQLLLADRMVRRRTAYQMAMFAVFNLFWTAVPLLLAHRFGLTQSGIALFALAGAGGALAAPFAGRLGDRGYSARGTGVALAGAACACLLAGWAGWAGRLLALVVAAVLLDAAVQLNQVLGQRILYARAPHARGRLNANYMTAVFGGGAAGSLLAPATLAWGGWPATAGAGALVSLAALLLFAGEPRER